MNEKAVQLCHSLVTHLLEERVLGLVNAGFDNLSCQMAHFITVSRHSRLHQCRSVKLSHQVVPQLLPAGEGA